MMDTEDCYDRATVRLNRGFFVLRKMSDDLRSVAVSASVLFKMVGDEEAIKKLVAIFEGIQDTAELLKAICDDFVELAGAQKIELEKIKDALVAVKGKKA